MQLLSIIIPAHNEEKYIEKTLKSITNSTYKNYEIIVICDSCTDKTEQIARKYTNKVYKTNYRNTSKNRNLGAKKAKSNYLIFIDADTTISKNYLKEIFNTLQNNYDYGTAKWVSEKQTFYGRYFAYDNNKFNLQHKIFAGNCFIKKDAFNKLKGFNESMLKGEDSDLGQRLFKSNYKFKYLNTVYYIPSERKYNTLTKFIKFYSKSFYETILYFFFREKYNKKFSN